MTGQIFKMTSQIFKMTSQICFTPVTLTGHICCFDDEWRLLKLFEKKNIENSEIKRQNYFHLQATVNRVLSEKWKRKIVVFGNSVFAKSNDFVKHGCDFLSRLQKIVTNKVTRVQISLNPENNYTFSIKTKFAQHVFLYVWGNLSNRTRVNVTLY